MTGLGFDYFSLIMCVLSELYIFISLENQSSFILTECDMHKAIEG